jgi:hypothetical protein
VYEGHDFEEPLRLDFLIDDALILEFKGCPRNSPSSRGTTHELYEAPQKTVGASVQFPRTRPKEWDSAIGP